MSLGMRGLFAADADEPVNGPSARGACVLGRVLGRGRLVRRLDAILGRRAADLVLQRRHVRAEEEGEFGSVWAMNELHRWAFPQNDAELLSRVFAAVDELYADDSLPDGDPLAIEFFEAVCAAGREQYDAYIAGASREWFDMHGW